jgi:peptidoglycan/LPS O-acetylase OafA/YrhL
LSQFRLIATTLLGTPTADPVRFYLLLGVGLVSFVLMLQLLGNLMGAAMAYPSRSIAAGVLSLLVLLVAGTAANLYLVPLVDNAQLAKWIAPAVAAVVLLAAVTPLVCALHKVKYFKGLATLVLSMLAAGAIVLLAGAVTDAVRGGRDAMKRTGKRTSEVNEIIGK